MAKLAIDKWWQKDYIAAQKTRKQLQNATVIKFDARGCMASDHVFQWVGTIYDFEDGNLSGEPRGSWTAALIQVAKSDARTGDIRDGFVGHERVIVEDGSLQYISPGLYFYFK